MERLSNYKKIQIILLILIIIASILFIMSLGKAKHKSGTTEPTISEAVTAPIEEIPQEENTIENEDTVENPEDTSWDEDAEDTKVENPEEEEKNSKEKYHIKVNYGANVVTVYKKDNSGKYTVPVKAMVCSTGKATPTSGTYKMSNKYRWHQLNGGVYGQYCSRITGHILFHSVPYATNSPDSLKYTAYAALINKTAVCQGYASLFYRLALDAGVDTRVISGEAGGPHAWNIVKLNGKYYNLDSTWDAGRSTYAYFLKNTNDFDDHVRDNDYQSNEFIEEYPMWDESYTEIDCNKYGHNYSEPIYKWSVDNMTVTAQRVCANNYEHVEEETVTAQKIVKDPTCTENGIITYIANFKNNAFKPQTKIVDDKKATGHKVVVDQAKEATCTEKGEKHGICTVCGHEETREIEALGHEFANEFTVDKEATTTEEGSKSQHCLHAGCTEKTNVTVIPKLTAGSEEVNPTPSTPDNKDDANVPSTGTDSSEKAPAAQTGDTMHAVPFALAMIISAGVVVIEISRKKKAVR